MKQKLLFLLTALMLLTTGNAWGGVTTLLNIDYSTTTTPAWTVIGGSGSIVDGAWKHVQGGGGGNRSAYLDFGVASSIDDNWTVEFDAALKPGSDRNDQQITVAGANTTYANNTSATGYMYFAVKEESNGGTTYTVKIGNTNVATGVTLSNGTTYHFKVEYDGSSAVTAYIGETKYEGTVAIANVGKLRGLHGCVARYNGAITYDNIVVTKEVNAENVSSPTIAVAYAGENRTVTITPGVSSESNVVTTYYTLNGDDPTSSSNVYSSPLDIDADCTVKAISISSTSVASEIVSQAVSVGKLKLVAPTFTKTGYAAGKYTVSMASNQSSLAFPPASYTNYYSIDGGDAVAYSAPFELNEGSTVTGYVVATNYTNSDEATLTSAVRPILSEVWSIDFAGQATEDKGGVTIGEAAFTASGVSFGNITSTGLTSNDNFGVKTGTTWLLRNNSRGLYSQNGSGTPVGVQGLKVGQYIKMVVDLTGLYVSDAASLVDEMSTVTEKYIVVNSDGNANINFDRYGYIKSISVCDVITPVQFAILDCKKYDSSAAFATAIDAESFASAAEVYTFNTSYHVTNGVLTDGVRDITGVIRNAQVNDAAATDWAGAGTYSGEQYTGAPDPYFIDNNGANMWATQWVYGLPAGKYQVKVATRGAAANYNHIYISNGTEDIGRVQGTHVGNTGGELGNGWSWTYVPFEISETTNLIFGFYKNATNWAGCDDWHLYRVESVTATIGATGWTTFSSAYPLNLSDISASEGEAQAYYASSQSGSNIVMTPTESEGVAAGEGLMLKGTAGATVTIPVVASGNAISGNMLVGCPNGETLTKNASHYLLYNNGGTAEFRPLTGDYSVTVPAGKAYLNAGVNVGARLAIILDGDDPTAINAIEAAEAEEGALKDGKYLIDGKVVLVKNGVKYDANGKKLN